ncbi:MAG TPA: glycosyltransferase family 4 protein [Pelagibacterium sp.]|uniref:glycosyltransferase family 4 protein n=1 Tax=Pelagibacterium sp. TaxID=1967288 RepID=UPI002CDF3489|nr:glycosyltransferase family 4 protein [Pelagibacterium sp.]HWJ88939.1 glycosyltransferase family 4 protein [Pelagibacterium sp.]
MNSGKRFALIGNQAFSLLNFRGPLLAELVERGHTAFALAPDFDDETQRQFARIGVETADFSLSRTGLNPVRDMVDLAGLVKVLRPLRLDCVLSFAIKPVIYGTLAARLAGIPRRHALIAGLGYAFADNSNSLKQRSIHLAAKSLYRLALAQTEKVFMQNPDDAEDFVRMGLVSPNKIVPVNGTGVDLSVWTPAPPVTTPVTFVLAARLLEEKGIFQFVEAARRIKSESPETRFILLGGLDTNPNGIARSQVQSWVDEGLVEWPGHVPVRDWLAQASVFVLPSYYREGVPRSIQEAMAMGRPIITTDAPGCRETVIDGKNGLLIPPRDIDALVKAMRAFIDQPELIVSMGQASRAYVEEKFDIRQVNATMISAMGL